MTHALLVIGALLQVLTGTLKVAWDPNSEPNLAGYIVLWSTDSGVYRNSAVLPTKPTEYEIKGLVPGTRYYVIVKAFDDVGAVSPASTEVTGIAREETGPVTLVPVGRVRVGDEQ